MKKVCFIFDHPYTAEAYKNEPHNRSFSAALLEKAKISYQEKKYEIDIIDLHKDGFDPVMHKEDLAAWRKKEVIDPLVKDYQRRIMEANELIFIFPIWWEVMPAMTKGFFDKVLAKGIIYEEVPGKKMFKNQFKQLEKVSLVTVMATPSILYRIIFGNPVTKIVFRGTFRKMGIHKFKWFNFSNVQKLNNNSRLELLEKFKKNIVRG